MSRKKKDDFVLQRKVAEMTQECDNLATRYWRGEASSREQGYEMWLKQVKKISHFIDVYAKR
jgi:hypothetical protein